jgi:hypothetical protein
MQVTLILASASVVFLAAGVTSGCVESKRQSAALECNSPAQCDEGLCHDGRCLDPEGDEDSDSVSNRVEVELGTDPYSADSDGDGADDAAELGPNPSAPLDSDGDDVIDALESSVGDSDRDCIVDELDPDELGPPPGTVDEICSSAGICANQRAALRVLCSAPRSDVAPSWECDYSQVEGYAERDGACDEVDEDCDGETDEDYLPRATFCGEDSCTDTGTTSCVGGVELDSCEQAVSDDDATCDGVDDDCDGETDEDFQPLETSCGIGPCEAVGVIVCEEGDEVALCTPEPPVAADDAICDGVDEDCDGATDEDFSESQTTCGVGACAAGGERTCEGGVPRDSCTPKDAIGDADATCDGSDDDCDGDADEDFESVDTSCGGGDCAATGATSCLEGEVVDSCVPGEGSAQDDDCDALDDDCDGETDEHYAPQATSCGLGACASSGVTACVDGSEADDCQPGDALD